MNMPVRWRLILGNFAEDALALPGKNGEGDINEALEFLYGREYGEGIRKDGTIRMGGREASSLSVPTWIAKIRRLFLRRAGNNSS